MKRSTRNPGVGEGTPVSVPTDSAASLLTMASDITVMLDPTGTVTKVTFGGAESPIEDAGAWVGTQWVDTVTPECRGKVEHMLREAADVGVSKRRQVNHPTPSGADVPVAYSAVRMGDGGDIVAVGRDLRAISALQQRLVETQQAMERDYWRLRHVETRYRLLFQFAAEAILVLEDGTMRVVDANAAAEQLLRQPAERLVGRVFPLDIDPDDSRRVTDLFAEARALGRAGDVRIRLSPDGPHVMMSASCFRQDAASLFMVRLAVPRSAAEPAASTPSARLTALLANAPDAFVVTDSEGEILSVNRAFLDIAQLTTESQAVGRSLGDWIGRPGADLGVFLDVLREHGAVRLVSTAARGEHGNQTEVEVSAVADGSPDDPVIGFVLRDVGRRVSEGARGARDLTRAVEQLTSLVGRVQIRNLIRDTTDLVERHFIEAALELTKDNRTAAAEVLGLSRQSLYVKLRRYGLAALDDTAEKEAS
jgi:transcriptional regulator PpsR